MTIACTSHQIVERHVAAVNFFHSVPHGVTLDTVIGHGSTYWVNAWKRFEGREGSTLDILAEDGSFDAHARILKVTEGKVTFRLLREWHEERSDLEVPKGYRVEFVAGRGWRALDPASAIVIEARPQKIDALIAALDHATAYAPKRQKVA